MYSIAATKLADLVQPKTAGDPVNVHVVEAVNEPKPDFDAMKRLIESDEHRSPSASRESEE
jgi:hypothetical protein